MTNYVLDVDKWPFKHITRQDFAKAAKLKGHEYRGMCSSISHICDSKRVDYSIAHDEFCIWGIELTRGIYIMYNPYWMRNCSKTHTREGLGTTRKKILSLLAQGKHKSAARLIIEANTLPKGFTN